MHYRLNKTLLVALLGTALEYFDYALYGFASAFIASHFFPTSDHTHALIRVLMIFAAGSLAKPIGAMIFGRLGDKWGRAKALKINMLGIAIPTFFIGILPGFETLGILAPLILLLCRLMQGIFIGGEMDGVSVYVLEHFGKKSPCFANSLIYTSASVGITLASFTLALTTSSLFPEWGWRLPFIFGSTLGFVTCTLRHYLLETDPFIQANAQNNTLPSYWSILKSNAFSIIIVIGLCGSVGGTYHLIFVFLNTYLYDVLKVIPQATGQLYLGLCLALYMIFGLFTGLLADRYGAFKCMMMGCMLSLVTLSLLAWAISNQASPFLWMILLSLITPLFHIPGYTLLIRLFPTRERYQCLSFGHAIGSILFSGTTPMISLVLWKKTNLSCAPFLYGLFLVILSLIALGFYALRFSNISTLSRRPSWKVKAPFAPSPPSHQGA